MPLFLLNLLPMLKKHWKVSAVVALVIVVFFAGWKVNGDRWEAKVAKERADRAEAVALAVAEREAELHARFKEQQLVTQNIALALQQELDRVNIEFAQTNAALDTARLVKPVETTCTTVNETGVVTHETQPNPFSDDFVNLWNDPGLRDN